MRFVAITPGDGRDLVPWLGAVAPWTDAVIVREPEASAADLARWIQVVRDSGCLAIRHARTVDVDADGVHLPDGMPLPKRGVFGASRHSEPGVREALDGGCAYVLLSPVFDPTSKPATSPPLGVQRFCDMAGDPRVLALGGISVSRARTLAEAGYGAAVLGALFGQPTPSAAGQQAARFSWALRRG